MKCAGMSEPGIAIDYAPGAIVVHPDQPDWGRGQAQSAIGDRVTVNFEHAGKQLINVSVVALTLISDDERDR